METILSFDKELDIGYLDKLIETQNDPKVIGLLNEFMNHPLAWTRIGVIFSKSINEKTIYFGLTMLGNVIKKQWVTLTSNQRHPVLEMLLQIVGLQNNGSQTTNYNTSSLLIRKKSCSLISEILVKEYPQWTQFIELIIISFKKQQPHLQQLKQQLSPIQSPTQGIKKEFEIIESLLRICKDLSIYYKRDVVDTSCSSGQSSSNNAIEFDALYNECRYVAEIQLTPGLTTEAMEAMASMFDLIDTQTYLQSFVLFASGIEVAQTRGTCVLVLIEYINVLATKDNNTVNLVLPKVYQAIITSLSKFLPTTAKQMSTFYITHGILLTNIVNLLILIHKSFSPLLHLHIQQLSQLLIQSETFITHISWINDPTIYMSCLDYWELKFIDIKDQNIIQLYSLILEPICRVLYKLLKLKDIDLIDTRDNPCKGILYKDIPGDLDSEEWTPMSKAIQSILMSLSKLFPQPTYNFYFTKLLKVTNVKYFSSSKFSSACWCLSYSLNNVGFENTPKIMENLYQFNDPIGGSLKELVYLSVLVVIRNATNYISSTQNDIIPIVQLICGWITRAQSTTSPLLEMSLLTLLNLFKIRGQLLNSNNDLYISINQIILQSTILSNIQKSILYECIGYIIINSQSSTTTNLQLITDPLNQLLVSKSLPNSLEGVSEWSNFMIDVISYNISLAKSSGLVYQPQLYRISSHLLELYKWAIQDTTNTSLLAHQTNVKKSILDLIEISSKSILVSPDNHNNRKQFIDTILVPLLSMILEDKSKVVVQSISQFLPRLYQFIGVELQLCTTLLPTNIFQSLINFFLAFPGSPKFIEQIKENQNSTTLIQRIWDLYNIIFSNFTTSIQGQFLIVYFNLLEICLDTSSTSTVLHAGALESISKYLHVVETLPNQIKSILFNTNLILKLLVLLINNSLKSEFKTSTERFIEIIYELMMVGNKYSNNPTINSLLIECYQPLLSQLDLLNLKEMINSIDRKEIFEKYFKRLMVSSVNQQQR